MAFLHGKSTFVLLNGYNITGYLDKIETPLTADNAETSCFGNSDKSFVPGLRDATLSGEGLYDASASAIDEIFNTILAGANSGNNIMWIPGGNTIGNYGYAMNMIQTLYNTIGTKDDAARIGIAGHSSTGRERVKLLHAHGSEAATGQSASQNLLAAGSAGGSAYLFVTAITGTLDVIIQHSTTGAFGGEETTLCTFTQNAAIGHERLTFSGTVNQYVRAKWTIGTGPATFAVAVCKD